MDNQHSLDRSRAAADSYLESLKRGEILPFPADVIDESEEMRVYKARLLGLPEESDWETIETAEDRKSCIDSARVLGLNENAGMDQIIEAERGQGDRIARALLLGLPRDATYGEINAVAKEQQFKLYQKISQEMIKNGRG